jgi:hypothetical protein
LSHSPGCFAWPFCFSYFSDRVSCFFPGPASNSNPLTYTFCIAGITGRSHLTGQKKIILRRIFGLKWASGKTHSLFKGMFGGNGHSDQNSVNSPDLMALGPIDIVTRRMTDCTSCPAQREALIPKIPKPFYYHKYPWC